ncbi:MAG: hypothetical protein E7285_04555 [Lachnospiraceae bacterium]|nr:hypothetical protein [Lachnospiraceae bacterium]
MNIFFDPNSNQNGKIQNPEASGKAAASPSIEKEYGKRTADSTSFVVDLNSLQGPEAFGGQEKKAPSMEDVLATSSRDLQVQRDYMTVMSNSMSEEDFARMQRDGYHPEAMEPEEVVTVVDEIKATMAKSGKVIHGYNDNIDTAVLEEITGSKAYANAIKDAFEEVGTPATKENVTATAKAMDMAKEVMSLSDGAKKYMVENALAPTVENLYLASHSGAHAASSKTGYFAEKTGGYYGKNAAPEETENLLSQMKKIIENAGYETGTKEIEAARKMVESGISLTEDTFDSYMKLEKIQGRTDADIALAVSRAISEGKKAMQANLAEEKSLMELAVALTEDVQTISDEAIRYATQKEMPMNLRSLLAAEKSLSREVAMETQDLSEVTSSDKFITAKRQMEEIRLMMTVENTYHMLKFGISVDTAELSRLVEELKMAEEHRNGILFAGETPAQSAERASLFAETTGKVKEIPFLPASAIGSLSLKEELLTLEGVHREGRMLQGQYDKAGERYETMMTAPRADLGDSMTKAFANVSDLLAEIGMEDNALNQKAVRILGYNRMEVNPESVTMMRASYEQVHRVVEKMTPGATLDLIRDGINPLQMSMEELENMLDNREQNPGRQAEKYSHFLYELEKRGDITEAEKEAFIGIHRLLYQIEKRDSASVGAVVNQGAEMTLQNLLTTVRSRKNSGIDVKVDDKFGSLEDMVASARSITDQIENNILAPGSEEETGRENILEPERMESFRALKEVSEEAVNTLKRYEIPATTEHLLAMDSVVNDRKFFRKMKDSEKFREAEEKLLENISASMEEVTENFTDEVSAKEAYERMADALERTMESAALEATDRIDVREFSLAFKQVNIIRRLAKEEYYEIPMAVGDDVTSVNVRIIHDEKTRGKVSISLDLDERGGKIAAYFENTETGLSGTVVVNQKERMEAFKGLEETLRSKMEGKCEISTVNFIYSDSGKVNIFPEESDEISRENKTAAPTRILYETAKTVITYLSENLQ